MQFQNRIQEPSRYGLIIECQGRTHCPRQYFLRRASSDDKTVNADLIASDYSARDEILIAGQGSVSESVLVYGEGGKR